MNRIYICLFCLYIFFSCVPQKKLLYLKNEKAKNDTTNYEVNIRYKDYQVQSGDILNIEIYSTSASSIELFNKELESAKGSSAMTEAGLFLRGNIVDEEGNIELPLIGKIQIKNLTTDQINLKIQEMLKEYITYATVETKITNFRVTVLGEVNNPGTHIIYNKHVSIFQALGMSGDITDYGNRDRIKLIRQTNGKSQIVILNISKSDIINSEYYYLYPNDVIYVEPLKAKSIRVNSAPIQITLSVVTLLLVIFTSLK